MVIQKYNLDLMIRTSIFNDEVSHNLTEALDLMTSWGQDIFDLREYIFGKTVIDEISDAQRDELLQILSRYKFDIGCIGTRKLIADPDADRLEMINLLKRLIKTAKAVNTDYIRICSFAPRPEEEGVRLNMLAPAVPLMKEFADIAGAEGITLLLENKPTSITNKGSEMAEFLGRVNSPAVKAQWDVVNSWIGGYYNIDKDYEDCKDFIGSVHLKGAMGKKEDPKVYDRGGVMGQDEFPHRAVVERLMKEGFKNNITLDLSIGSIKKEEFNMTRGEISRVSLEYTKKLVKEAEEKISGR
jgi:sugar phosphate isomerase/epimerase